MIGDNIPPLSIKSHKIYLKETNPNIIVWDNALEDLLSEPISTNLESKQVSWKKITKTHANSVPINIESAFNNNSPQEYSNLNENSIPIRSHSGMRNHELKSRELMIKNIIQTPITPRKKLPYPKTGSTKTQKRVKTCLYDKKEVETIMYNRNQKPQPIAQRQVRKNEIHNLTRTFDFHVPSSIRSTIKSRNSYFG